MPAPRRRARRTVSLASEDGFSRYLDRIGRTPLLGPGIRVRPLQDTGAATPAAEDEMLVLSSERRARLVAFVEASTRMPEEVKAQLLSQLTGEKVPAVLVARIESRMGG